MTQSMTFLRDIAPDPASAYPPLAILVIGIAAYIAVLILLLSAIFIPEWWLGRRPIIWISLPYFIVVLLLGVDAIGRFGLIFGDVIFVSESNLYRLTYDTLLAPLLPALSLIGQFVLFGILFAALRRSEHKPLRPIIWILIGALFVSLLLGIFAGQFPLFIRVAALFQTLPVLLAFGYAIFTNRLLVARRIAFELAMNSLDEAVAVVDDRHRISFANPQAAQIGLRTSQDLNANVIQTNDEQERVMQALYQASDNQVRQASITLNDQILAMTVAPVHNRSGRRVGTLLLGRDITMLTKRTRQLEEEQAQLSKALAQIEAEQREREQLAATVRALTIPFIPVLPGLIVVPLVGDLDTARIEEFHQVLLSGIERHHANSVMLDITGITVLDTHGARGLLEGVRAAALLGARCVLVGVRPEIAQSLVAIGVELNEIRTASSLEQAVLDRLRGFNPQGSLG
ncbi:MAG: STAS domain-containing protein [Oscillochloris sp.]|nr:STAS domain-containing protein [Oscillochloris sp.]